MSKKTKVVNFDANRNWFNIKNETDKGADVFIYDEIGYFGIDPTDVVGQLQNLSGKHLNVRINSTGGSVFDGIAIYNVLKAHEGGLDVFIDGIAASIASVIAQAGDTIQMADNAMMMIHDPYALTIGTSEDLRKEADVLDQLKETIITTYQHNSGLERDELAKLMTDETWFDAAAAVEHGLATGVIDAKKVAASAIQRFDLQHFKKVPEPLSRTGGSPTPLSILLKRQNLTELETK